MQTITTFDNTAEGCERSLYAFLAEKERRSGSRRTAVGYSRMLRHFIAVTSTAAVISHVTSMRLRACPFTARKRTPPVPSPTGMNLHDQWPTTPDGL